MANTPARTPNRQFLEQNHTLVAQVRMNGSDVEVWATPYGGADQGAAVILRDATNDTVTSMPFIGRSHPK